MAQLGAHRRAVGRALLATAALAIAGMLGACGAEGGKDAGSTTTTRSTATSTTTPRSTGTATLTPADGWTRVLSDSLPQSVIVAYGAPDSRDNVNLLVEKGKAPDLARYWAASEASLAASMPGQRVIEAPSETTVDGHPAMQKVWSASPAGRRLQFWSVITAVDGDGYVFTYTAAPGTFTDHRADAEQMLESVRLPG